MGLFIIAGLILIAALVFHVFDFNCGEEWLGVTKIICFIAGCGMLFIMLLIMSTNRGDAVIAEFQEDYTTITCALEGADSMSEYAAILPQATAYNDTIKQCRKNRESEWTNWLYSPKVMELPLIDISQYDTGD